jgi:hypothetical protein
MNKENIKRRWSSIATIIGIFLICFVLVFQVPQPRLKTVPTWHVIWEGSLAEATEANPGAGASGFLEIYFINHTATPTTAYDTNTSSLFETWCNASLDADGAAGTTNHAYATADNFNLTVKWGVAMDVVCRARWNRTHAYDGSKFIGSDCRINITMAGGGITILGTTSGTNCISENQTDETYIWINVYWTNGGAGYVLNKNGISLVSQISIQAKY